MRLAKPIVLNSVTMKMRRILGFCHEKESDTVLVSTRRLPLIVAAVFTCGEEVEGFHDVKRLLIS
jgi:hypothetical protein